MRCIINQQVFFICYQLVLVASELTLDKLLTAKSKSSSSLSPASSPRGLVCVACLVYILLIVCLFVFFFYIFSHLLVLSFIYILID